MLSDRLRLLTQKWSYSSTVVGMVFETESSVHPTHETVAVDRLFIILRNHPTDTIRVHDAI